MRSDRTVALIPARLESTRFPGKLLADLGGRTVIRCTYEAAVATGLFDEVIVVCGNPEIRDEIEQHGGRAMLSKRPHESGTDRIAEAAENLAADIIVNVQGDEPFTRREPLASLLAAFDGDAGKDVRVATLMQRLAPEHVDDPNFVKVVLDNASNALYFSRARIPYPRDARTKVAYHEHIGIYAFRREALLEFAALPPGRLETVEKMECLRFLEHGIPVKVVLTGYMGIEIDTPGDLARAGKLMQ